MSFNSSLASTAREPWAVVDTLAPTLTDLVRAEAAGEDIQRRFMAAAGSNAARSHRPTRGVVAVIPIAGLLTKRIAWLGTTTQEISAALNTAVSDPAIEAIALLIDSPGGTVAGIPELADQILRARTRKPIIAAVDGLCASAAYWLASQATKVVVTPSGEAGSIGVYRIHVDESRALDKAGIAVDLIKAGPYKAEDASFAPLSDDARAYAQKGVDSVYHDFITAVARGRGVSPDHVQQAYGGGRVMRARDALRVGMIDSVATAQQALRQTAQGELGKVLAAALAHPAASTSPRHARLAALTKDPPSRRERRFNLLRRS